MTSQLTNRNKWSYCVGGLRDAQYNLVSMFLMVYVQYTIKYRIWLKSTKTQSRKKP